MKRALVCSGGGSKGAFQVGVLKHLMGNLGHQYSAYCGISVGALNSAYLAMFRPNDTIQAITGLESLWSKINTASIYKRWFPFGKLHGLWKNGLFDTSPLKEFMEKHLNEAKIITSGNDLRIGAVSLDTGEYKIFDETYHDIFGAVLASSSFPIMFEPVELDGQVWTDGGVRDIAPMGAIIDLGATEVDVILTSPEKLQKAAHPKNALEASMRTISIMTNEMISNDIDKALLINELVKAQVSDKKYIKINIYRPEKELTGDSLDFNPDSIKNMISYGYEVAAK